MSSSSDRIIGLYERQAAAFDADRGKSLVERQWLDRFSEAIPPHADILDLGCGSGEPIARELIERRFALTGIDSSPTMIDFCKRRFPNHEWMVADMRHLDLGRRYAGLIAWDSFFHLTPAAQRAMFPIFAKHAAPGARLMFTSGPSAGEAIGSFQGEPLYHASLDPAEYRALLEETSFELLRHIVKDPDCGGRTVWLAHYTETASS